MIWKPNPGPQEEVLSRSEFEILYGGARGGGKTDAGLVWLTDHVNNPKYRALVIRKNADDLTDWVDRASTMYSAWNVRPAYRPPFFRFPSGAIIRTGHLKDDQAYTKYQGHEYHRMLIEELTQIPDEKRYLQLISSCRSTVDELKPQIFMTTNPGGIGHGWVKSRFIDVTASGKVFYFSYKTPDGTEHKRSRIFIPAKLEDNPKLKEKDPGYIVTLEMIKETDEELYKAWRLGDWDTFAGQFFREFSRQKHVLKQFTPNPQRKDFTFIAGLDWGRAKPFAFELSLIYRVVYNGVDKSAPDWQENPQEIETTFNRTITFGEVYGTEKKPSEWSDEIRRKYSSYLPYLSWVQCDNQIFTPGNDNSMSIFEQFCQSYPKWRELMKAATKDRLGGWVNMHNWLSIAPDGVPYWLQTDNCINLIRTLPLLVHDDVKVEDIDTEGEDHAPDACRYQFSGFKWIDGRLGAVRTSQSYHNKKTNINPAIAIDLGKFESAKETRFTVRR